MKFSEIEQANWQELQPYLDTCLLPLTGLTGEESPWQVTESLEKLRDLMDFVEIPFKGRIVTYPALQYTMESELIIPAISAICQKLKASQFKYVILITADEALAKLDYQINDLLISLPVIAEDASLTKAAIMARIQNLWK